MKEISNEPHPITRARERYGIDLTISDLQTMQNSISSGKSVLMGKLENNKERHLVSTKDCAFIAVYDPEVGRIMTVLPKARTKNHRKERSLRRKVKRRLRAKQTSI